MYYLSFVTVGDNPLTANGFAKYIALAPEKIALAMLKVLLAAFHFCGSAAAISIKLLPTIKRIYALKIPLGTATQS